MQRKFVDFGRRASRLAALVLILVGGFVKAEVPGLTVHLAGSSAHAPALLSLLRLTAPGGLELCRPGSLHVYAFAGQEQPGLETLYRCLAGPDAGVPPGNTLVVAVTTRGGAGAALGGLTRGPNLQSADGARLELTFLVAEDPAVLATPGLARAQSGVLAPYQFHGGLPPTVERRAIAPDLVLADLEPAQFAHSLRPVLSAAELRSLAALPVASVIHGVPLTRGLWQRLQALEFPASSTCHPQHPGYGSPATPGSAANSPACTPSLSKAQVQGLLTGALRNWGDLRAPLQPGASASSVGVPGLGPLVSSEVHVERREASSGTQRAFEIFFHAGRCGEAGLVGAEGGRVHVNASDAELARRLARHDLEGRAAIGLLPTTVLAREVDRWRFVKISGTPPSLRAAATGQWELWFEGNLHFRRTATGGLPPAPPQLQAFAAALARGLGDPSVLRHLNAGFQQFTGPAGLMARATESSRGSWSVAATAAGESHAPPVAQATRVVDGSPVACANPVAVGRTPVSPPGLLGR